MAETLDEVRFNPYDHEVHEDPFPIYRRLRDEAPAYHDRELGFWALSRYDDVMAALHDPDTYCSREGITLEPRSPLPLLITFDPPEHTAMRRLISRAFTPRRIASLEDGIRALARGYVEAFAGRGEADVIGDLSARLPMDVISEMLAVPTDDRDRLRAWTDAMIHREPGNPDVTPEGIEAATEVFLYFDRHIRDLRANPGDDLVSGLLEAELEGRTLTQEDIISFCFLLIIAGNETTTKLIGNAVRWLAANPGERAKVLADPARLPDAVEETLRYDGSTQLMARTLTRDVRIHGSTMAAGSKVMLLLGSANRDERAWDAPDDFLVDRWAVGDPGAAGSGAGARTQHLAFGHGAHVCLGAALARLEMRVVLEELHARVSDYVVDESSCRRMHSGNVRGFTHVPITFTPSA